MPLFDYVCESCGQKSEILVRSAGQKIVCPACSSKKMKRQFSTFSTHMGRARSSETGACPSAGTCPSGTCPMARR